MRIVLINPTLRQLRKAIGDAQAAANVHKRTRTIADHEVAEWATAVKSRKNGRKSLHGGHVANAYRYPAYAAAIYVYWATDQHARKHVVVCGHTVSASKGSGIGHPLSEPSRDKLDAEKRHIELVYPSQYVTDAIIRQAASDAEAGFLRAIKRSPRDAAVRMIFADWLDENGQPERAAEIRSIWAAPVATPAEVAAE